MSLRINHNISSLMALNNLRKTDTLQRQSLERLSTGLRINRASDDPSGLVISERLRAQISGLKQAVQNAENAGNMIGTAEAALNEVHSKLINIRDSVLFSINTGGGSLEQVAAEQDSVDNAIKSIERIAATTRFGDRPLLNGVSGFEVTTKDANISELTLRSIQFAAGASSITFSAHILSAAERADFSLVDGTRYTFSAGDQDESAIIRIKGNLGVEEVSITSTMNTDQFDEAINAVKWNTGVYASGGNLYSNEFGSDQSVSLEVISGTFYTRDAVLTNASGVVIDKGVDVSGDVNGTAFSAKGLIATVNSNFFTGELLFTSAIADSDTLNFSVNNSGLTFQLNGGPTMADRETIGIISVDPSQLGSPEVSIAGDTIGGKLSSLLSGSDNDMFSNPINALRIVDDAIDDVSDMRAYLGSFQAFTIDTNVNSLEVAIENLTASESNIRDVDFAEETAELTRHQILYQAGTAVLAQANLVPQSVLTLLQ